MCSLYAFFCLSELKFSNVGLSQKALPFNHSYPSVFIEITYVLSEFFALLKAASKSDIELDRKGISYSIDTIQSIKGSMNLTNDNCYFLVGTDTLLDFHKWKKPKEILNRCQVIVAVRPGFRPSDLEPWILHKVHFANVPRFEISSKTIRTRWVENKTIRYMVTLPVWDYINKNDLYSKK